METLPDQPAKGPLRIVGIAVIAIMALALLYATYMALSHWSGIGV